MVMSELLSPFKMRDAVLSFCCVIELNLYINGLLKGSSTVEVVEG